MDSILIVNAGSSSVKFQVFAVDHDGRLRRQIKGQMDGIGTRPRLRATGAEGEKLADRAYPIENVQDIPAALQLARHTVSLLWSKRSHSLVKEGVS